ncbi:MAG: hypothetical protein ACE5GH_06445 [Fidelibacterota bacterium]
MSLQVVGAWIAVLLTLSTFSYLYKDNPFYKAAEHIFVGVSAGYWASTYFWTQIQPNLFGRLWPKLPEGEELGLLKSGWYSLYNLFGFFHPGMFPRGGISKGHEINMIYLIPLVLGIFMIMRIFPKVGWLARWAMAYVVGLAAGLRMYGYLNSNIIAQVRGSALPLFENWFTTFNSLIILVGTVTGLFYFFFSKAHTGIFGKISRVGIYFLMISFGASFGFAVMGRISLLIGRYYDLMEFNTAAYHHATGWILIGMIILLAIWAFTSRGIAEESKS